MKKNYICFFNIIFLALFFSCASNKVAEKKEPEIEDEVIIHHEEVTTGLTSNVNGTVFGDLLGDGVIQGIPGIEITLDDESFVVSFTDGTYLIPFVKQGNHTLYIHDPDGKSNGYFEDQSYDFYYDINVERFLKLDIYLERNKNE